MSTYENKYGTWSHYEDGVIWGFKPKDESITEVEIPKEIDGVEITGICNAFNNDDCKNIEKITFPADSKVTSIGNFAFRNCTSLQEIKLPDNLTSIGDFAFPDCTSLQEIKLPDKLTSIGNHAFKNCTSLKEITFPENSSVTSIGDYAFSGCSSLSQITIPEKVTSIGNSAFENCTNLKEIKLPDKVTSIGGNAFEGCTSLKEITFPENVSSISKWAFNKCSALEKITITNPFQIEILKTALDSSTGLNLSSRKIEITIKSNDEKYKSVFISSYKDIENLSENSFTINKEEQKEGNENQLETTAEETNQKPQDETNKTEIKTGQTASEESKKESKEKIISNKTNKVGTEVQQTENQEIKSTEPNEEENQNDKSKDEKKQLETHNDEGKNLNQITDKTSKNEYGKWYYNTSGIIIGFSREKDIEDTFTIRSNIEETKIKTIGDNAFIGSTFTFVEIQNGIEEIKSGAFLNCKLLQSITIPDSIKIIGSNAFGNCSALTKIEIPGKVKQIGEKTFFGCNSLSEIKISSIEQLTGLKEALETSKLSFEGKRTQITIVLGSENKSAIIKSQEDISKLQKESFLTSDEHKQQQEHEEQKKQEQKKLDDNRKRINKNKFWGSAGIAFGGLITIASVLTSIIFPPAALGLVIGLPLLGICSKVVDDAREQGNAQDAFEALQKQNDKDKNPAETIEKSVAKDMLWRAKFKKAKNAKNVEETKGILIPIMMPKQSKSNEKF